MDRRDEVERQVMTKLHSGVVTLAFSLTATASGWAQTAQTTTAVKPSATGAQTAASEAARAGFERARLPARPGLEPMTGPALDAPERAHAESQAVLASGRFDEARAMAELMACQEATLAGHAAALADYEAMALASG